MPGTCLGTLRVRVARTRQRALWRKLRTTNVIQRCFAQLRRRTRPMVSCVNVQRVERIIFSIFKRFKSGPAHPLPIYTSSVTSPLESRVVVITI